MVAATPPMGWNSWNFFAGKVTDKDIRDTADLLVSSGMRDAGYVYVNIDDTWEGKRDTDGKIQSNEKFPDMKALADYVHSKGLKLGIYSSPGSQTCARYEGSLGHEDQDAAMYAEWGIDYRSRPVQLRGRDEDAGSRRSGGAEQAHARGVREDAPGDPEDGTADGIQPVPVRDGFGVGVGAGGGCEPVADDGDISANFDRMSLIGRSQAGLAKFAGPGHWTIPTCWRWATGG